jgi:hypothetical protein
MEKIDAMHSTNQTLNSSMIEMVEKIKSKTSIPTSRTLAEAGNQLIVRGQGTIAIQTIIGKQPFRLSVQKSDAPHSDGYGLEIAQGSAAFYCYKDGNEIPLYNAKIKFDTSENCWHWFSIDSINHHLVFGQGEQREKTSLMSFTVTGDYPSMNDVKYIHFEPADGKLIQCEVCRDPVVIEPALLVVPKDQMTMDMAAKYQATVIENLSIECQKLYSNVAGDLFELNTPDFPNFVDAIAKSIRDPQGWCYKKLKEKESEFGPAEPLATYLRITLGVNQGESPGIPYVMEIWPSHHYSPIHNHAGANAIIKVLHGDVTVQLFDMLSITHKKPFEEVTISKGDVTWITPNLNQTHKLHNQNNNEICVTIQCYLYNAEDKSHYEYFDYIETDIDPKKECIKQFLPNSDIDFLDFKYQMKKEWMNNPVYLYQAENPPRYYYTTDELGTPGQEWTKAGIAFNAFQANTAGAVPVYQFSAPSPQRYDFRTGSVPSSGWTNDNKTAFYVLTSATANSAPVYQYHQIIGNGFWNLFYSLDPNDPNVKGWINDGIAFYAFAG